VASCPGMEVDGVMDADSDVKTWTGVNDVLDSEMEEMSCLVTEAEADAEELCAMVEDDS
jgi:hypothetical protein